MKTKTKFKITNFILVYISALVFISGLSAEIGSEASFTYLEGQASWYAEFSPGIRPTTANMEKFDDSGMTCAMWGIPFNTVLEVTNVRNGRSVLVRVNDRGPAKRLYEKGRIIDLTRAAFREIEDLDRGLASVRIKIVKTPR